LILLDYSSIAMSSIMVRVDDFQEQPELVRHQIFNIIRQYNERFRGEFGEMVIAMDHTHIWRKKTFPQYKANRKKQRKASKHDWNAIFTMMNDVREEVETYSPYRCIRIESCEADDVIATIIEAKNDPSPTVIVSPDKDFVQLQKFPNVKQFSNIQKKWVEPDVDPVTDLEVKVLKGDMGDGIPNVMSDDNVLVEENARQTPLRKAKMDMLMADPEALGTTIARRIIRNRDMIDLSRVPQDLKSEILEAFNLPAKGSINSLMSLFTKHQMKLLIESLQDFEVR
tara:strand:- start:8 stop:856 length:849 start_codon:yes stop_codon:yes gene_type:complete